MGVTKFDGNSAEQLTKIVQAGVASFKVFLAYQGAFGVTDEELYQTLKLARKLGVITAAHCENAELIAIRQQELLAAGRTGPEWHHESRPPRVEAEGVHHLMTFAEMTGAHVYVVHLSCEEALREATRARERGVKAWVETLIQYLVTDKTFAERPNFEGSKFVMSPPLREQKNQAVLWNGLAQGLIHTLATDHAPFDFKGQKEMGRSDFTKIPNGIPSLEDRVTLLYTHGVKTGKLDLCRFVEVASTELARLFGLAPRKGAIAVGADADLVVWHPDAPGTISAKTHHMNIDYSAFEGWKTIGKPEVVTVRGEVAFQDGKFTGKIGRGKFLAREATHGK